MSYEILLRPGDILSDEDKATLPDQSWVHVLFPGDKVFAANYLVLMVGHGGDHYRGRHALPEDALRWAGEWVDGKYVVPERGYSGDSITSWRSNHRMYYGKAEQSTDAIRALAHCTAAVRYTLEESQAADLKRKVSHCPEAVSDELRAALWAEYHWERKIPTWVPDEWPAQCDYAGWIASWLLSGKPGTANTLRNLTYFDPSETSLCICRKCKPKPAAFNVKVGEK